MAGESSGARGLFSGGVELAAARFFHLDRGGHGPMVRQAMKFEDWPEEWQEWVKLTPLERFRESEKIFANYLAMGGSLDPDPDPTSPFYDPSQWNPRAAHGRAGLRVLRRGAS